MTDAQLRIALLAGITILVATFVTYVIHAMVIDRTKRGTDGDTYLGGKQCDTCGIWREVMSSFPDVDEQLHFWLSHHECFPSASGFTPASPIPAGRHRGTV